MAKRITLPIGMTIAEADSIGDYTFVSGRDYDVTNITTIAIRNTLGESNNDVGLLCSSNKINKWAAFKPYREGMPGMLNPGGMILDVDDIIKYLPANTTYGFSMGHFAGYNHNAPIPGVQGGIPTDLYYTAGGIQTLTTLISLPEFDVRDFGANILGVGSKIGSITSYTPFTVPMIETKLMAVEFSLNCNVAATTTPFSMELSLGYDNAGTYVKVCEYPNDDYLANLTLSLVAYNLSAPTLSLTWDGFGTGAVLCSWSTRHADVVQYYILERSTDGTTWGTLYNGASHSYLDGSALPNTTYYYRLTYKFVNTGETTLSSVTITTGPLDGGQ